MDSFTERMVERAKARKDRLKNQLQITDGLRIGVRPNLSPLKESNFANSITSDRSPRKINDDLRSPHKVTLRPTISTAEDETDENVRMSPISREGRSPFKAQVDLRSPSKTKSDARSSYSKPETNSNFNVSVRLESPRKSNISLEKMEEDSETHSIIQPGEEFTIEPENIEVEEKSEASQSDSARRDARQRLKKLGALYSGRPSRVSSPIQQTEEQFAAEEIKKPSVKSSARSARLAALASQINQWEDDLKHTPLSAEKLKSPARPEIRTNPSQIYTPTKPSSVDQSDSPFKTGSPRSINFRSPKSPIMGSPRPINILSPRSPNKASPRPFSVLSPRSPNKSSPRPFSVLSPRSPNKGSPRMGSVLQKAIAYEQAASPTKTPVKERDPAELTLAERKALFERNKGEAILPKVPFGQPLPARSKSTSAFNKGVHATSTVKTMNQHVVRDPVCPNEPSKVNKLQPKLAMFEQLEKSPHEKKYNDERQKDLEMLRNRWDRFKNIPDNTPKEKLDSPNKNKPIVTSMHPKTSSSSPICNPPPMPDPPIYSPPHVRASISPIKKFDEPKIKQQATFPSVRPIVVSPPKPGNLYPSLSDAETEMDSETADKEKYLSPNRQLHNNSGSSLSSSDNSLRREILEAANEKIEASFNRKRRSSSSLSSSEQKAINSMDDFLDEALSDDSSSCPSPTKQPRNNYSIPASNTPSTPSLRTSSENQEEDHLPLTHTVSFYRKLQNQNTSDVSTPAKKIVHQNDISGMSSSMESEAELERELVEKKIAELQQKISTEQTVISQATQALNLCFLTVEFSNSTEQVEAERLLLLATHKRQAALNELQRLKIEGTLRPNKVDSCYLKDHGSLTISEIALPIKIDAIRNAAREDMCHHFVCLLKCDENVFGTSLITAAGKSLEQNSKGTMYIKFPNKITFPRLYSDFKITLEVYDLIARSKEVLPHDIKYHISNKKESHKLRITPKKHKTDSRLVRPPVQSPAGPSAVRTSSFSMVGYAIFSLREIQRTQFTLNKVTYTSPLEGVVQLKMSCELSPSIEHRGFLTMFEDISGFGAWHRRWCLLKGDSLSYWKYPDDETTRVPIDTIDLNSCTTKTVSVVSRDICARPNTFLLETIRPSQEEDVDSLVLVRHPSYTMVRHLLSADTKEERIEWCTILNKALAILRAWGKK